eukprot:TRINITY_DN38055_c0_g1_i1.p1 TRINITY_DN38055_c0_g1~~TRINITY_DN38055_c0_g1_i1.p1  ORF type:complete len:262 (+),score=50.11 TRINITY_DN38055_c0_g1_i1:51-836(+)
MALVTARLCSGLTRRFALQPARGLDVGRAFASKLSPRVDVDQESRIIQISPAEPSLHTATCIFMHGLGDTANGFAGLCHSFAIDMPHVRFICPTAPEAPVTLNGGMRMTSWYDIKGLDDRSLESCDGIEDSKVIVEKLLEKEAASVGHHRCVLAGFSQGGAMALYVGLQLTHRLAGIVALSSYMPTPSTVAVSSEARKTPVLQCHGEDDAMVKISAAHATDKFLESAGIVDRSFHVYPNLGHAVDDEEIQDLRDFLSKVLP